MSIDRSNVRQEELMRHLRAVSAEVRLSGSPEEARAFDYIEAQLKGWGYTINRYSCDAYTGYPQQAWLKMIAPGMAEFPANGYSLSPATPPEGIEADLVDAGDGSAADFEAIDAQGKIVLTDGLATPGKALLAAEAGAVGHIHNNGDHIHEMCISPIWGTPTPETAQLLPSVPAVAISDETAGALRASLVKGAVKLQLMTQPYLGWSTLPVLTAELLGTLDDSYVLFSGHVDSWHLGAMDNGTANATQLEVARILSERKDELKRGIRVAFWSGHSHARYAGSTWYADTFFDDISTRCVCHVNIDSVGAKGAVVLEEAPVMAETFEFTRDVLREAGGIELEYRRMSRSSDQSFWGHGVPSTLAALSEQEVSDTPTGRAHAALLGGGGRAGGLGWWWHTTEDTIDKIDPDFLVRDAWLYLAVLWELCTRDRLPIKPQAGLVELADALEAAQIASNGGLKLGDISGSARSLAARIDDLDLTTLPADEANALAMNLCRLIIPVNFTASGPFDHDLALGGSPAKGLAEAAKLGTLDPKSSEYRFLRTKLVRARNRIAAALRAADGIVTVAGSPHEDIAISNTRASS
jgi:Peptidase family M28/PA domain